MGVLALVKYPGRSDGKPPIAVTSPSEGWFDSSLSRSPRCTVGSKYGRKALPEVQHLAQVKAVGSNPTPLSMAISDCQVIFFPFKTLS